jgi:oxalate decarboxylase/phosphoglucose isomerase-like protein (cupin superfamily)
VAESWNGWEMHPAGDELVYVITGEIELVFEESGRERLVRLSERRGCVVPRGVWHTANVGTPSQVLHITPGAGTQQRPRLLPRLGSRQ